jgi:hypothetical protein
VVEQLTFDPKFEGLNLGRRISKCYVSCLGPKNAQYMTKSDLEIERVNEP